MPYLAMLIASIHAEIAKVPPEGLKDVHWQSNDLEMVL